MSSGEWDGRDNLGFHIFIFLVLSLVVILHFNNWINKPSEKMNEICIDNGFEEATDYKRSNNNTLIECDEKEIFNTTRIVECYKPDKWGECKVMQITEYVLVSNGEDKDE